MTTTTKAIVYALLLINVLGLVLMYLDKYFARKHHRRIRESTLMWVAALGGSVGSLCGMYLVRHKTLHKKFTLGIPALLAGQLLLVAAIFYFR